MEAILIIFQKQGKLYCFTNLSFFRSASKIIAIFEYDVINTLMTISSAKLTQNWQYLALSQIFVEMPLKLHVFCTFGQKKHAKRSTLLKWQYLSLFRPSCEYVALFAIHALNIVDTRNLAKLSIKLVTNPVV